MKSFIAFGAAAAALVLCGSAAAQTASDWASALAGNYRTVPDDVVLPGGLRNQGSPEAVRGLKPSDELSYRELVDPKRVCQPIGPFRMMAEPDLLMEFIPDRKELVLLFQDAAHGFWRTIHMDRPHRTDFTPSFQGDSVGRWADGTLTVRTQGFSEYVWLNANGWRHGGELKLTEQIKPILDGEYLEYRVTAEDPKADLKPYAYVRYLKRTSTELVEDDACDIEDEPPAVRPE